MNELEKLRNVVEEVSKQAPKMPDGLAKTLSQETRQLFTDKTLIKNIDDKDKFEWIVLRTKYANKIFWLLSFEVAFIGAIVLLDGFSIFGFNLNKWLLGTIFCSILGHTFFLVKTIVKNLFIK